MASFLAQYGEQLLKQDYEIIPIKSGLKHPGRKKWASIRADTTQLNSWLSNGYEDGGVGVLTRHTPAIDIDIKDYDFAMQVAEFVENKFGLAPQRTGMAPKTLFVFRADEPFPKVTSPTWVSPDGEEHKVEGLGNGQQFVAFAVHPDTQEPYEWALDYSIADIHQSELIEITRDDVQEVIDFAKSVLPDGWAVKKKEASNSVTAAAGEFAEFENYSDKTDLSDDQIDTCLDKIAERSDDYDDWYHVGMALFHQFDGQREGFDRWDAWSQHSAKYDPDIMHAKWRSFNADLKTTKPKTFASVLQMAKEAHKEQKLKERREDVRKLDFLTVDDLMTALGPISWQVEGILEQNTTGFVYGAPQSYKSFVVADISLCIATGRDWHGHKVKQAPVIYIAGEGHNGFARRVKAWADKWGGLPSDTPFRLAMRSVPLTDETAVKELCAKIDKEAKKLGATPGMVVVDTLARNFGPGNENSQEDANKFIENVEDHIRRKYGCIALIVHHTGHASATRGRGSSVFGGAADFEYMLERDQGHDRTCLTALKMKDAALPEPHWFEGVEIPFELPNGDMAQSLIMEPIEAPNASEEPSAAGLKGRELQVYNIVEQEGPCEIETLIEIAQGADIEPAFPNRGAIRSTLKRLRDKSLVGGEDGRVCVIDEFDGLESEE